MVPIRSARGRRGRREYSFAKGRALVRITRERSSRCPRRARTSRRARCSRARDRHRARRSGVQHPRVGEDVDQVFLSTLSDFFSPCVLGIRRHPSLCGLSPPLHIFVLSRNRSGRSSERRAGSIPRSVLLRFASTRCWYFPLNNRPTFRSLLVSPISRAPGSRRHGGLRPSQARRGHPHGRPTHAPPDRHGAVEHQHRGSSHPHSLPSRRDPPGLAWTDSAIESACRLTRSRPLRFPTLFPPSRRSSATRSPASPSWPSPRRTRR